MDTMNTTNTLKALKGRSLIEPDDLTLDEMETLFTLAEKIETEPAYLREAARGKLLATLFFEPSTRTRLSFEAAMLRLGGSTLGFAEASSSSTAKGESLADTIRTVATYADVIAMRNPKEGSSVLAKHYSAVPVINAGDGGHYHPTQTLTDILTIKRLLGKPGETAADAVQGLTVGFCGDLKFGRTVHSLSKALARYPGVRFVFVSPTELRVPEYITKGVLDKAGRVYAETDRLEEALPSLDILYMTRVQKERFFNEDDYVRLKDSYILTPEKMTLAKKSMFVLHPLPRVNEIAPEVDADPRAAYFKQMKYGMYVRMALLASILGVV
jgi:aspartate carbamoyltransferase catalytic subunit